MKIEPWFHTISGIKFDILNPTIDMIDINDIAHSLAMQCRWLGHCKYFFSVAEHAYHVSHLVSGELALHGLLHDAAEAYVGDIITPYKTLLGNAKQYEHKILHLIFKSFGVKNTLEDKEIVKYYDAQMISTEARVLDPYASDHEWLKNFPPPADISLECWVPSTAKAIFLDRFYRLTSIKESKAA